MTEIKGVNLIIDSNYILYRSVYSLVNTNTLYGDLEKCLEIVFNNYLNKYPYNKIYMVSDSKSSWRKRLYSDYKSERKEKREKNQEVDWEFVFNTYDKFKENINNPRIVTVESESVEGDDWINSIINQSNLDGYSTLCVTSDKDLNQKVEFRLYPTWINIQWNDSFKNGKVYLPKGYKIFIQELLDNGGNDLFSVNENTEFLSLYNDLINKNTVEEIDKEQSLFVKIISGDAGDCIESVLKTPTKTNPDKKIGIGDAGAVKIWEKFKSDYPEEIKFEEDKWIQDVMEYVLDYKKVSDIKSLYEDELKTNLMLNRSLIHLHEKYLPNDIKQKIKNFGK